MKTLVIHPDDRSTDFLRPIYQNIPDHTLITSAESPKAVRDLIDSHDRILMMGHGGSTGLFGLRKFGKRYMNYFGNPEMLHANAIDRSFAEQLREKECVYIWCNADKFVNSLGLNGYFTGMFISEVSEARWFKIKTDQKTIDESNDLFAKLVGESIDKGLTEMCAHVHKHYGKLAKKNVVAAYNWRRLYLYQPAIA